MGSYTKLYFGNKSYWYLKPSEELVLKIIINVLRKAPCMMLGTTELVKNVKYIIDAINKKKGLDRKVQQATISRLICVLGMVKTCKKVGSRRCMKTFEIKRKRIWKYIPEKKKKNES